MPSPSGSNNPLATRAFDRLVDVPAAEWDSLAAGAPHPFLDRRYLGTLERTLEDVTFQWLLIDDPEGHPVAAAGLSVLEVDVGSLGSERLRGFLRVYRKLRPTALRYNVVLCGMPISNGRDCLAIDPTADPAAVVAALDAAAVAFAGEHRGRLVVFKEYDDDLLESLAPLEPLGYDRIDNLPLHVLPIEQATFDEYVASRSKRMRRNIRDYFRSGEAAGFVVEHLPGREVAERFTDDVHALYLQVFDKATLQFEQLPRGFFEDLATSLPEESRFTFVRHGERTVGFVAGIRDGSLLTLLKVGYDTTFDPNAKLYFFTMYSAIKDAFNDDGLEAISIGQGADEFKRRLGCVPEPRRFLLKGRGLFAPLVRWFGPRLFPKRYGTTPNESSSPK